MSGKWLTAELISSCLLHKQLSFPSPGFWECPVYNFSQERIPSVRVFSQTSRTGTLVWQKSNPPKLTTINNAEVTLELIQLQQDSQGSWGCVQSQAREIFTLRPVGADDSHGADPVRRDLGYQGIKHFKAGGVHDQNFGVMPVAQEPPFPLRADGELIELRGGEQTRIAIRAGRAFPRSGPKVRSQMAGDTSQHSPGCLCVHRPAW